MGVMLTAPIQPSELAATMRRNIDWRGMSQAEAQNMHLQIMAAARLVTMAAPEHLQPVRVRLK